jgi:hypothetical protein
LNEQKRNIPSPDSEEIRTELEAALIGGNEERVRSILTFAPDVDKQAILKYLSAMDPESLTEMDSISPVLGSFHISLQEMQHTEIPPETEEAVMVNERLDDMKVDHRRWRSVFFRDYIASLRATALLQRHTSAGLDIEELKSQVKQDLAGYFEGSNIETPPPELSGVVDELNKAGEHEARQKHIYETMREDGVRQMAQRGMSIKEATQQAEYAAHVYRAQTEEIRTQQRLRIRRALSRYSIDELTNLVLGLKEGKMPV